MPLSAKWSKILVPTDFSPFAKTAVDYAHKIAEAQQAELHVLHVTDDSRTLIKEHGLTGVFDPNEANDDTRNRDWLTSLLGEPGTVRRVDVVRLSENVAETIVDYAAKNEIDLIVIATHGRTGLSHLLMGSVTERVLRNTKVPILVVRPE